MRYVRSLDHAQVVEASRQHLALWGEGRTVAQQAAKNLAQLDAAGPEFLRYVGLVDGRGRLAGALKRYALLMTSGAIEPMRAVGIGAVFTKPSARDKGVATTLLRAVMDEARELGYAAALLYSDIDPAFYERLGFVALPARDWAIAADALPARGALEVRRAKEGDLDRLRGWYEAAWRDERPSFLRPARSRAIWRYFGLRNRISGTWIVTWRGRDAGYIIATPHDPRRDLPELPAGRALWFDEAAAPGVPRERVWATVRALAERARARGARGWVGPDGAPSGASRMARPSSFPMIAPLGPGLGVSPRRAWLDSFMHF